MTNDQMKIIIARAGAIWPRQPIDIGTAAEWGRYLSGMDYTVADRVLDRLATTEDWLPSIATFLKAAGAGTTEQASLAFKQVLGAFIHPPGQRDDKISETALETVRRMGGWGTIGQWEQHRFGIHQREFERVFSDVAESFAARDIGAPVPDAKPLTTGAPATRALSGRVVESAPRRAPTIKGTDYTEQFRGLLAQTDAKPEPRRPESMLERMVASEQRIAAEEGRPARTRAELAVLAGGE